MSSSDDVTIRSAETPNDYGALQAAQRLAWGISDERHVIPLATMVGANLHGGLVLGAFLPDGSAVGVSFAFLGRVEGRLCLYSQLTGVVPEYQGLGIGTRMKNAQREFALREELDVIAWAFDPLRAGNARFNIAKLGAYACHYYADMYGPRTDALNAGGPTDRLLAEWPVTDHFSRPAANIDPSTIPNLIEWQAGAGGSATPRFRGMGAVTRAPWMSLEIPDDIAAARRDDPRLAAAWLQAVRAAFRAAFKARYGATGFVTTCAPEGDRHYYLLEKD